MESLAYLEMAVAYENARQNGPDQVFPSLSINLNWHKISSYVFLSSLVGFLTILGWPMMAHSQEILTDEIEQTSHTKQQRPRRNSSQIRCNSGINSKTKAVQDQLRRLGYFNRSSTGCYGPATRQALLNFQSDQGLPVTGNMDQATLVALNLARRNVTSPRNRPIEPPRFRPRPRRGRVTGTIAPDISNTIIQSLGRWRGELKLGHQNNTVKLLQLVLKTLGYNLEPNGIYDSLTRQVVESYQRNKGLQVTGRVGKTTMRALLQDLSQGSITSNENLRIGDNNPIVLLVQQQLQMMGLYNGPLNGFYSSEVAIAVGQFQQFQGIPVTNEVGAITLARLLNLNSPMMTDSPWFGNNNLSSYDNTPLPINLTPLRLEPPTSNGVRDIDPSYQSFIPSSSPRFLSASNPTGLNTNRPRRVVGSNRLAVTANDLGDNEIKEIQTLLNNAGYYQEAIDGVLGIQTQTAIFLFQEDKGLPATGEINQQTLSLLRTYRKNDQDTNIAIVVPVPPVNPTVYPPRKDNYPTPNNRDVVPVTPVITPTIKPDNHPSVEDEQILDLQRRLSAKGFYNGPLNGVYNWQTKLAIARAQLAYGITINDVIKGQF